MNQKYAALVRDATCYKLILLKAFHVVEKFYWEENIERFGAKCKLQSIIIIMSSREWLHT
jgi:hypothetical protein